MSLPRFESPKEASQESNQIENLAPIQSTENTSTVLVEPSAKETVTSVHNIAALNLQKLPTSAMEMSAEESTTSPSKQVSSKKKEKVKSNPMLLDIALLKLDANIVARLQEADITTIGDLVPNRSKNDLANNPLLNRKLRREIEARLKSLKVILSAK